jgi:hypothetical protein
VSALAQYLERDGIATTHISLVREHTEAMQPPRALWVPFMLGRPFGAPNVPALQRKVLVAALELLEAERGPIIEDFPEDAPGSTPDDEEPPVLACPINLTPPPTGAADSAAQVLNEIAQLQPWHDIAAERSGRQAAALTGLGIEALARFVISYLGASPQPSYGPAMSAAEALKRACDDLKTFYLDAASAQPGNLGSAALEQWFWRETAAGKLFLSLRRACLRSEDEGLRRLGERLLVPRAFTGR